MKCYVPFYLFCSYRMCNIFIMIEKVKKKISQHFGLMQLSMTCQLRHPVENLELHYPGTGQSTPTPNILVTLNL